MAGTAFLVGVDVTSVESLTAAAKEIESRAGGVNLLCANAGVLARHVAASVCLVSQRGTLRARAVRGVWGAKTIKCRREIWLAWEPSRVVRGSGSLRGEVCWS